MRAREAVSVSLWAAAFGANVHFARIGSNYFAQAQPPSPLLHFWTLSVEEQFYLVWPALLAAVFVGASRRRLPVLVVAAGAGIASLAWSIHETRATPTAAYFSTFARAWELALGAVLAIAAPRLPAVAGWIGLAAIAAAAVGFSSATPFPGYAALLPAGGAALVIAAGLRPLSAGPLRYIGDRSYAFYLWHWPVLAIAAEYAGRPLATGVKLALVAGAFGLSVVSYRLVEDPIRRVRLPMRVGALVGPACAAVVLATALSLGATAARVRVAAAAVPLVDPTAVVAQAPPKPLPAVVAAVRAAERGAPLPSPLTPPVDGLHDDFYFFPDGCTPSRYGTTSRICRLGDPNGRKTIVVFGDSHAEMWMPTILAMAQRDGWVVIPLVKVRCIPRSWVGSDDCAAWFRWARRRSQALRPAVTLIVGSRSGTHDPLDAVKPVADLSRALRRSSASVIVLGDSPNQTRDPTDCLLAPGATMKTCTAAGSAVQAKTEALVAASARRDGAGFIDTRPWFCAHPRGSAAGWLCPLVVNQTITAIDRGHASRTYVLELLQPFRAAFRRELFR